MTDDSNITHLHPRPRAACTGEDTGPVKRLDGLRLPADLVDGDALAKLGLGRGIPHSDGSTRVGIKTLRELRERARGVASVQLAAEQHRKAAGLHLAAAEDLDRLVRVENETLARRLAEIIGDGPDEPKGAA
jgi:hypothetical protein